MDKLKDFKGDKDWAYQVLQPRHHLISFQIKS